METVACRSGSRFEISLPGPNVQFLDDPQRHDIDNPTKEYRYQCCQYKYSVLIRKFVPEMTYYVFGGTLNPSHSLKHEKEQGIFTIHSAGKFPHQPYGNCYCPTILWPFDRFRIGYYTNPSLDVTKYDGTSPHNLRAKVHKKTYIQDIRTKWQRLSCENTIAVHRNVYSLHECIALSE